MPQRLTHRFSTTAPALNHYSKVGNSKKERPKIADSLLVKACELNAILGALFLPLMKWQWIHFFSTHTEWFWLIYILQQCCSGTPLTSLVLKYSEADEVQVCLDPKEDLGRPQRPPQMNAGEDLCGGTKGSRSRGIVSWQHPALTGDVTQDLPIFVLSLDLQWSFSSTNVLLQLYFFLYFYLHNLGLTWTFTSWWAVAVPTVGKIKVCYLSSDSDQHTQFRKGANLSTLIKQVNYFLALQSFLYLFKGTATWQ